MPLPRIFGSLVGRCGQHESAGPGEKRVAVADARRSGSRVPPGRRRWWAIATVGAFRGGLVADVLTGLLSPARSLSILGDVGYAARSRGLLLSIGSARMVRGHWFEYAVDRGGHVRVGRWTCEL